VLYVDHGCDFTSKHLDQVAASLKFRIVYSAVARPQGRGKIERLFGTLNSELLPELPGHLVKGKPTSAPKLSLAELDRAITAYIANTYNVRVHSETSEVNDLFDQLRICSGDPQLEQDFRGVPGTV
jgi:putative transposase